MSYFISKVGLQSVAITCVICVHHIRSKLKVVYLNMFSLCALIDFLRETVTDWPTVQATEFHNHESKYSLINGQLKL
jgi:hypothetical protein